jgi:hypothetical protein
MKSFRQFILTEWASNDISTICQSILNRTLDVAIGWDMLIQIMTPINPWKAGLMEEIASRNLKVIRNLFLKYGKIGFLTTNGSTYKDYVEGKTDKTPGVVVYTSFGKGDNSVDVIAKVPFKKAICDAAIQHQMGLHEYVNKNLTLDKLELNNIEIIDEIGYGLVKNPKKSIITRIKTNGLDDYLTIRTGKIRSNLAQNYEVEDDFENAAALEKAVNRGALDQ